MPELNADPRFADALTRLQQEQRPAFMAIFEDWLSRHTRYEAMAKAQAQRLPLTAVNPPSATLQDPHFRERGAFVEVEHPVAGRLPYTHVPFVWRPRRPHQCVRRPCSDSIPTLSWGNASVSRRLTSPSYDSRGLFKSLGEDPP